MIGYYLPSVPFSEAPTFVKTSRLSGMGGWRMLNDGKGGSIVSQVGWDKALAKITRTTQEGWGYAPNPTDLPPLATLVRKDRPESEPISLEDGSTLLLPLVKRSPRRAIFTPGGGGYGPHVSKWALMALQLWADCRVIDDAGRMRIQYDCRMVDLLATLYACISQCYHLTHELASDLICLSDLDMMRCMEKIWGCDPKACSDDGGSSPSSQPAMPTSPLHPAKSIA
jgi:hypothetical protein